MSFYMCVYVWLCMCVLECQCSEREFLHNKAMWVAFPPRGGDAPLEKASFRSNEREWFDELRKVTRKIQKAAGVSVRSREKDVWGHASFSKRHISFCVRRLFWVSLVNRKQKTTIYSIIYYAIPFLSMR
jgi:hypothetical protein